VIADVNHALRALLTPRLPTGGEVRFGPRDRPSSGPDETAVTFFLAGVREDEKASGTEWEDLRGPDGRVVARRPPIRRFDLHYLVTAQAPSWELEAQLLDAVLAAVDPGTRVAPDLLGETLADHPVVLRLGERPPYPTECTTLSVVANAPLVLPPIAGLAPPAESIRLAVAATGRDRPASRTGPAGPRRWRGTVIEEESDAVRGEDE
jgi:hypothetical protein